MTGFYLTIVYQTQDICYENTITAIFFSPEGRFLNILAMSWARAKHELNLLHKLVHRMFLKPTILPDRFSVIANELFLS